MSESSDDCDRLRLRGGKTDNFEICGALQKSFIVRVGFTTNLGNTDGASSPVDSRGGSLISVLSFGMARGGVSSLCGGVSSLCGGDLSILGGFRIRIPRFFTGSGSLTYYINVDSVLIGLSTVGGDDIG